MILPLIGLIILGIAAWYLIGAVMLALFLPEDVMDRFLGDDRLTMRGARLIAVYAWPVTLLACLFRRKLQCRS